MRAALLAVLVLALGAASCQSAGRLNPFGGSEEEEDGPDRERRESFLTFEDTLEIDPSRAAAGVTLPASVVNVGWPNEGGTADHAVGHPSAGTDIRRVWRRNVGAGSGRRARVAAPPVVADGMVFAIDGEGEVNAFDMGDGDRRWRSRLRSNERRDREFRSGGIAYGDGRIFVAMGFGAVAALDANTGEEIWRTETSGPMHAPPTFSDGRVYAVSFDNELFALSGQTGEVLWAYPGLSEPARILTASSPAVSGDVVLAPFASGELTALRADNGRVLWADSLTRSASTTALSSLNDIAGSPVIVDNVAYAMSHSGVLAAFDVRTGQRIWDQPAGGIHMPWVAGDYLFVMTNDSKLACLSRLDGATVWLTDLPQYRNPDKRKGRIAWAGPVLAGGRLLVASSEGRMISVNATTGAIEDDFRVGDDVFIAPIVANETVYLLTDDANLVAYR